ncbi:flagellar protein FlaG [Luminiphilus sp.]|nr:flagellar protein FlaG [Luminiphilus sp.]
MDNITSSTTAPSADATQSRAARPVAAKPNADVKSEADMPELSVPRVSVSEVAADAAEGKLKSLSTLASVTESIHDAVEVLNETLSRKNTSAQIRRDEELNRYLVTIKDKDSGEVVREVPPEALLKFARNLQELKGILFDETL